jgi:putative membrane protein
MRNIAVVLACVMIMAPAGAQSATGAAPSTADFVRQAAISDMFEIEAARLAQDRGDPRAQQYAAQMLADHQKTTQELKSMVDSGTVQASLPTDLNISDKLMLTKLRQLKGNEFTSQYFSDQQIIHIQAISLFRRYATGGDNPTLKAWAGKTLPIIQHHRDMAGAPDVLR